MESSGTKHICVGILAHVDAGKTTLAEGILYLNGKVRKLGRVDHRDAFLDTYELEKERGITIFSKQALIQLGEKKLTLLDTPGHVDFSAEMERTLQVLDAAILVISGADGVQGHVETLWKLLKRYRIPVFLFVNKMDQEGTDKEKLLAELKSRLDENCVDFSGASGAQFHENNDLYENDSFRAKDKSCGNAAFAESNDFYESIAMCSEKLLEEYLESGVVSEASIRTVIAERKVFPCCFGSALKLKGVEQLLELIERYAVSKLDTAHILEEREEKERAEQKEFGARVFKISRDPQKNRLTHLKVTGGSLRVKSLIGGEKVDQIRLYAGSSYTLTEEAVPGMIVAVTGLTETFCGQGLGVEPEGALPLLEPVLTFRVDIPEDCEIHTLLRQLKSLEEEEPELHVVYREALCEIHVQVMGEVQVEILKSLIHDRFGVDVGFDEGNIVYKETIANVVEGIGHFEPLRHYAEVHLLMEPGEPGSGLELGTKVSEDVLDRNWQRLIMTHLEERSYPGVLTGSEITDMKITLIAGRAHQKHTEGGDFRQATYRAVRQGLMKARSILLEPYYEFTLELPTENMGRAMTDIQKMNGSFETPEMMGEVSVLKGKAPVSAMRGYQTQVTAYTRGRGRLLCSVKDYEPCDHPEEVIEKIGYNCEADLDNPGGSVFCAHGAGYLVSWDQVDMYAHLEPLGPEELEAYERAGRKLSGNSKDGSADRTGIRNGALGEKGMAGYNAACDGMAYGYGSEGISYAEKSKKSTESDLRDWIDEEELEAIFARTFGANKKEENRPRYSRKRTDPKESGWGGSRTPAGKTAAGRTYEFTMKEEYLLVDGYNIIFAWKDLKELSKVNIDSARDKLMDILSNYQGFKQCNLILVFDAYKVKGERPGKMPAESRESKAAKPNVYKAPGMEKYHNIYVVYTKEGETADQFIEKAAHELGRKAKVTVATSDALEQTVVLGQGAHRISALGLLEEVENTKKEIKETWQEKLPEGKNYLFREQKALQDFKEEEQEQPKRK